MKKRIFTLVLVIVTIINIIAAAFIFIDIQVMQAPETTVKIDFLEINSDEVVVQTTIDIYNPNVFDMIMKDFELTTTAESGEKVAHTKIDGGRISANRSLRFAANVLSTISVNG